MSNLAVKTSDHLRTERHREAPYGIPSLMVACLWPKTGENLGTLLRTCDAVGAGMVVPAGKPATRALRRGDTVGQDKVRTLYVDPDRWLGHHPHARVVGVELAHGAIPLAELRPANPRELTIVVLGHERTGIPAEALPHLSECVEIPMQGVGNSLNVAVAGSLVLYKLAGMS